MSQGDTQAHHANDAMRCACDGEPWPCEAWRLARRRADLRGNRHVLIYVEPVATVKR